jgi:xanthine dehydrogenase accessory factor
VTDVPSEITKWTARGDRSAAARVVDTQRSAPRSVGTKMAVSEYGAVIGGVSGGWAEGAVAEIADRVIGGEQPRLVHFGIADSEAWDVGLPCGGEIDVWVQAYQPGRFAEIARAGGRAAEITLLEGAIPGAKLLVQADGARSGTLGAGFGEAELERISAPLGLDLGATSGEETALSILAEVVAARHGREGGRLANISGRIHEVPA